MSLRSPNNSLGEAKAKDQIYITMSKFNACKKDLKGMLLINKMGNALTDELLIATMSKHIKRWTGEVLTFC